MQKLSVGRIVHYFEDGTFNVYVEPRAAIVVYVWSDTCCNLVWYDNNGVSFPKYSVTPRDMYNNGWSWPERV